ncbi:MAG TPA: hypothetical protein VM802_29905 [Chitinophaga sp.]|uniref:HU domain-containing protein n=1 Tax=Chitinophaga sp. TaxID=1869181 RepID=UPI002C7CC96F|nr:hypothetical protein [Chitinophaga sp.]HVI49119.1 hypothetical protein [Chitinophaga sp.]
MILQQYIQEVLFRQRVCVVPQLGTFTVQHFPAQYNSDAQTLTPPRDQVIFSQSWQDDGSCLEWIALKENLVPAVAQRKLERYTEELKAALRSGNPIELPGIGQLQGDFAGNINFLPETLPVNQDALTITPIHRETPLRQESPPADDTPSTAPSLHTSTEPIMTREEEATLEAVTEESIFKWWWAVAGAVIIIGGLGTWWYISNRSTSSGSSPAESTEITADTIHHHHQASPDSAQGATATVAPPPAPVNDSLSYYVVIDTYEDSLRAVKQTARRNGWKQNVVMYKRNDQYKVAIPVKSLPADTARVLEEKRKEFKTNKAYLEQ